MGPLESNVGLLVTKSTWSGARPSGARHLDATDLAGDLPRLTELVTALGSGGSPIEVDVGVGALPGIDGRALSDGAAVALYFLRYVKPGIFGWDDVVRFDVCWAQRFIEAQAREACALVRSVDGATATLALRGVDAVYTHLSRGEALARTRAAFETLESVVADGLAGSYGISIDPGHAESPALESLASIVEAAESVAGRAHALRYVVFALTPETVDAAIRHIEKASDLGLEVRATLPASAAVLASSVPRVDRVYVEASRSI